MWRFILLTFAFLGFAFYELSGGADYEPISNSIQARAIERSKEPTPIQTANIEAVEQTEPVVIKATPETVSLDDLAMARTSASTEDRFEVTLAAAASSNIQDYVPTVVVEPEEADAAAVAIEVALEEVVEETAIVQEVFSLETYADLSSRGLLPSDPKRDQREVTGNVVNMRAGPGTEFEKTGTAVKGMQVSVLEDPGNGWLMLEVVETGETGWMADWLVTEAN